MDKMGRTPADRGGASQAGTERNGTQAASDTYGSGEQGNSRTEKGKLSGLARAAVLVCGCFLAAGMMVLFWNQWREQELRQEKKNKNTTRMSEIWNEGEVTRVSKVGQGIDSDEGIYGMKTEDTGETKAEGRHPESDFFRQAASNIWGKDYRSITAEEYACLTSIQIDTAEKTLSYQLSHGAVQTMSYGAESQMDTADLAVFSGLEWLSLDRRLHPGDLQGLEELFAVYARNNVNEMRDIIPYPEKITELGIADDAGEKSLEGIQSFPNLTYLSVSYPYLEDISALGQFPALQGLMLEKCDSLSDYGPLTSLTDLEWLKVGSEKLEEIDFISSMEKLTSLSVEGSRIRSLDVLKGHAGLAFLTLRDNPEITDYSIIGELYGLTELSLEMGQGGALPSFQKLKYLERLSLKGVEDLSPLENAGSVISLFLDHCSGAQLKAVSAMQELDTLEIHGFSTAADSLKPLTELPKLTSLNLRNVAMDGNIEGIFGIPSLKNLYLDHCRLGLDFSALPVNESLEVLSMNGISLTDCSAGGETQECSLSEHAAFFDCFPNLTELYLESLGLEDIAFVEKLPHLQHLDIRDNPVKSLKELQKLDEIRTVWYGGGTIVFP